MQKLKLSQITPDPSQPRQEFDPKDLHTLKESIAAQGILQPLVVEKIPGNGHYMLIDGERRFRASVQLKLKEVPVEIMESMSDLQRLIKQFHLQEQHRNWTFFDKARAIKYMIDSGGIDQSEIAGILGLHPKRVAEMLSIIGMSNRTQERVQAKRIPYDYIIRMNTITNKIKEDDLREKLEDALLTKIESGKIRSAKSLQDYNYAVKMGGNKIAKKIIKESDYTSEKALRDSKSNGYKSQMTIQNGITWLIGNINTAMKEKGYKYVDAKNLTIMKRAQSKLSDYIKQAEAVQE